MKITIEGSSASGWEVWLDDKTARQLCWDEMLGLVARLTLDLPPQYTMRTEKGWEEYDAKRELTSKKSDIMEKMKQYETKTWPPMDKNGDPIVPAVPFPNQERCLFDGLAPGVYGISCPCPKCSPRY